MPPNESPESQYDRLRKRLQDSILKEYPNPERKGCPGEAVLNELAARPLEEDIEAHQGWHHVTHCSECYREFLGFRSQAMRHARNRRLVVIWGLAAAVVAIAFGLFFLRRQTSLNRPQNAELEYAKKLVDIESMPRSGEQAQAEQPIYLDRRPLELVIQLPVGSKAGTYEFQLQKTHHAVISTSAEASIREGTTAFSVKIDLTSLEAGQYSMSVRRVPWDWSYYPVVLR
jgi:hypothetical protein